MSDVITATVGETMAIVFDFGAELELKRQPNHVVAVGEYVTIGPYVYECTDAGKTAIGELDDITQTIGDTFNDGTVEWTCRDYSTSGTDTISTRSVTATSGITIDSSSISNSVHVDVTFTTSSVGKKTITCQIVTAAGETLISKLTVLVK